MLERFNLNNCAIIIVDMLNDFVKKDGAALYVPNAEKIVPNIKSALEAGRKNGVQIVYVCDSHDENDPEFASWPKHCMKGTLGAEIIDELRPQSSDLVIKKNKLSAMTSFHFRMWLSDWTFLSKNEKRWIFIVGVATEYCIQALVKDFPKESNYVCVLSDCIEGVELRKGDIVTAIVEISHGAHFVDSKELITELNAQTEKLSVSLDKRLFDTSLWEEK